MGSAVVDENLQKTLSVAPFLLTTALERGKTAKDSASALSGRRRSKVKMRKKRN